MKSLLCLISHWFVHTSSFTSPSSTRRGIPPPAFVKDIITTANMNIHHSRGRMNHLHNLSSIHALNDNKEEEKEKSAATSKKSQRPQPIYTKNHALTICMVPPPQYKEQWAQITKARTDLKDPGLFRWPPHANILYPFIDIMEPKVEESETEVEEVLKNLNTLKNVLHKIAPFQVSIDSLGTFGGKHRGVLFLIPQSFRESTIKRDIEEQDEEEEPLVTLQSVLQGAFPICHDQKKGGKYTPHITISHFPSLDTALEAKKKIEEWWTPIEFTVDEVYFLKRKGDGGQFKIAAILKLGDASKEIDVVDGLKVDENIIIHDPPIAFPDMPTEEEDWVYNERMKLKERRNGNGRRRSGRKKKDRIDRGPSKSTDTPEEIARKRAERAAKKELLTAQMNSEGDEARTIPFWDKTVEESSEFIEKKEIPATSEIIKTGKVSLLTQNSMINTEKAEEESTAIVGWKDVPYWEEITEDSSGLGTIEASSFSSNVRVEKVKPLSPIADGMIEKVICRPNSAELLQSNDSMVTNLEKNDALVKRKEPLTSKYIMPPTSVEARGSADIVTKRQTPSSNTIGRMANVTPLNPIADGMISKVVCRPNSEGSHRENNTSETLFAQSTAIVKKKEEAHVNTRELGIIEKAVTMPQKVATLHPNFDGMITKILCRPNNVGPDGNALHRADTMEHRMVVPTKKDISANREIDGIIEKAVTNVEKVTPLDPIADGMIDKVICRPNSN